MKLLCAPSSATFPGLDFDLRVDLFTHSGFKSRARAGALIAKRIAKEKLKPCQRAWDLLALALSVIAADHAHHRDASADGWTRRIHIAVAVHDPTFWNSQSIAIAELLAFLTTDLWTVEFVGGGYTPAPLTQAFAPTEDSIVLLSGGLDSLVGAIDLVSAGHRPMAVSHIVRGDGEKQASFAAKLPSGGVRLLQLNHNVEVPAPETPPSQRSRSMAFLAYGVLAATASATYQAGSRVTLYVCENGFIGINPPMTGSRIGSLSTRTTHPVMFACFQELLDAANICVDLINPYRFKTKGEMLVGCADQLLLDKLASESTSCGRFKQFGYKHCGRCVPCLIRRSAFIKAGLTDRTTYKFENLGINKANRMRFDDVRSAKMAVEQAHALGLERWLGATLAFQRVTDVPQLREVVRRGLGELELLLAKYSVK